MEQDKYQAAMQAMVTNLLAKTGKSVEEWVAILRTSDKAGFKERVDWLKANHGLGHGYAQMVVKAADQGDAPPAAEPDLIDQQYSGKKGALRPIYDRLLEAILALGADVSSGPRKTMVGFSRGRQFACVQASTATRVDLTLAIPGDPLTGRLKEAKATAMGRINRVVGLGAPDEVDEELLTWLREAYQGA